MGPVGLDLSPSSSLHCCRVHSIWAPRSGAPGSTPSKMAPPIVKAQAPASATPWMRSARVDRACHHHRAAGGRHHRPGEVDRIDCPVPIGEEVQAPHRRLAGQLGSLRGNVIDGALQFAWMPHHRPGKREVADTGLSPMRARAASWLVPPMITSTPNSSPASIERSSSSRLVETTSRKTVRPSSCMVSVSRRKCVGGGADVLEPDQTEAGACGSIRTPRPHRARWHRGW